jgi:esterase/lipase
MILPSITWHFSDPSAIQRPAIVIVHNFGGTQDQFSKHIDLLNSLGYDVAIFDLSWHKHGSKRIFLKPLSIAWGEEIKAAFEEVLKKRVQIIPFSFSGVAAATLDACVNVLKNKRDISNIAISKIILDSGPFDQPEKCVDNMLHFYFGMNGKFKRELFSKVLMLFWGYDYSDKIQKNFQELKSLSPDLKILSLQGQQDKIVPYSYIQSCLNRAAINIQQILFEKGGHLTALKEEPEKYTHIVNSFLKG